VVASFNLQEFCGWVFSDFLTSWSSPLRAEERPTDRAGDFFFEGGSSYPGPFFSGIPFARIPSPPLFFPLPVSPALFPWPNGFFLSCYGSRPPSLRSLRTPPAYFSPPSVSFPKFTTPSGTRRLTLQMSSFFRRYL